MVLTIFTKRSYILFVYSMRFFILLIISWITFPAFSQDTLKVMHYNLLNYGNYTSYCTTGNNNHEDKDGLIRTIIDHELPDIFTVNEINRYEFYHNRLLSSVLNTGGRTWYKRGSISNQALSDLVNMLYYNSDKLVLKSHEVVQSQLRDIDLFTLYLKNDNLSRGDTVYLHCLIAHLKAGSTASDEAERSVMTTNAINYLKTHKQAGNYLMMGDFNTYSSSEACYQDLIDLSNGVFRFFDPVNKAGNWSGNSSFASVHTQSVTTASNGCLSGGGMDDRFDHIMVTSPLINGTMGLKYQTDSYHALGQDGKHFNKSITDSPANTSVPAAVLNALVNNSDHLPVSMKLLTTSGSPGSIEEQTFYSMSGVYHRANGETVLVFTAKSVVNAEIGIYTLTGQLVNSEMVGVNVGRNETVLETGNLKKGVYLIRISDSQRRTAVIKMVR